MKGERYKVSNNLTPYHFLPFTFHLLRQMDREYPKHPMVGVGAVIKRKNSILLIKRGKEPGKGNWSIPGGLVELGETVTEAVKREVKEETGLEVEIDHLLDVVTSIIKDDNRKVKYHYVLIDYLVYPKEGELCLSSDASDVRWVKIEELEQYGLTQALKDLLAKA